MRRSIIPASSIRRIISAENRRKHAAYNKHLISCNMNHMKELPPVYELENFDFNIDTRSAKIVFLEIKKYRTIERYVTQNYVKYPIYSDWKSKTKRIDKSIKLTNSELESLNKHEDFLIKKFAHEIILKIGNPNLHPSWFILDCLKKEYDIEIANINDSFQKYQSKKQSQIRSFNEKINSNLNIINCKKNELQILIEKKEIIKTKISNIEKAKPSILLSLITFGIYCYYTSNRRKETLCQESKFLENKIDLIQHEMAQINKDNSGILLAKNAIQEQIYNETKNTDMLLSQAKSIYESKIKITSIKPLSTSYDCSDSFILLKNFSGFEYKKIVGCYIIHNIEKDKYYVGQSKDVLKRLKQHFKGTVPNNIIFAEDYYSSTFRNKENLFEVKIVPCSTKDELDETEKNLIEKYDSWKHGYNGTSGNN